MSRKRALVGGREGCALHNEEDGCLRPASGPITRAIRPRARLCTVNEPEDLRTAGAGDCVGFENRIRIGGIDLGSRSIMRRKKSTRTEHKGQQAGHRNTCHGGTVVENAARCRWEGGRWSASDMVLDFKSGLLAIWTCTEFTPARMSSSVSCAEDRAGVRG